MKKSIFSLIIIFLLTAVAPDVKSEIVKSNSAKELIRLFLGKQESHRSATKGLKKRKLKKAIRKAGRIYREVKPDRQSKKKSREIQRKTRRIINFF